MQYTNLVFEGGGVLGAAFAKIPMALKEFELLDKVEKVAGSSAGSIAATLIALKYSAEDIEKLVSELNFSRFSGDWMDVLYCFTFKAGFNSGYYFLQWIKDRIMLKVGNPLITFEELYERTKIELVITGTNLTDKTTEYFSHKTTPKMCVCDAVRISTSIPFYFCPVFHKGKYYIDGGVLNNYPISVFDCADSYEGGDGAPKNPRTLGFVFDKKAKVCEQDAKPLSIIGMFYSVIDLLLYYIYNSEVDRTTGRTVYINVYDISSMNFGITKEQVTMLEKSGYESTCYYLRQKQGYFNKNKCIYLHNK